MRPCPGTRYRGPYYRPYQMVLDLYSVDMVYSWTVVIADWITMKFSVCHKWPSTIHHSYSLQQLPSPSVFSVPILFASFDSWTTFNFVLTLLFVNYFDATLLSAEIFFSSPYSTPMKDFEPVFEVIIWNPKKFQRNYIVSNEPLGQQNALPTVSRRLCAVKIGM